MDRPLRDGKLTSHRSVIGGVRRSNMIVTELSRKDPAVIPSRLDKSEPHWQTCYSPPLPRHPKPSARADGIQDVVPIGTGRIIKVGPFKAQSLGLRGLR